MSATEAQQNLSRLFDATRSAEGEQAVWAVLREQGLDELRHTARALDRQLGERARRWKDMERLREAIVKEIMRRAFRNDVFLDPAVRSFRSASAAGPPTIGAMPSLSSRSMVHLTGVIRRAEGTYLSHCHELDIETCGKTLDEVARRTRDMIGGYLVGCQKLGTLDQVLSTLGVAPITDLHQLCIHTDFSVQDEMRL